MQFEIRPRRDRGLGRLSHLRPRWSVTSAFLGTDQASGSLWNNPLKTLSHNRWPAPAGRSFHSGRPTAGRLAFYAEGVLKRIDLDGGLVRPLAKASFGAGGSWNNAGVILFRRTRPVPFIGSPRRGIESSGHEARGRPGRPDLSPLSPDGRHFLYLVAGAPDIRGIYIGQNSMARRRRSCSMLTPVRVRLRPSAVHPRTDALVLAVRCRTAPAERQSVCGHWKASSENGIFQHYFRNARWRAGVPHGLRAEGTAIRLGSDRTTGREVSRVGEVDDRAPSQTSPSPDSGHLVLGRRGPSGADPWLLEIRRGLLTRFTADPSEDIFPARSCDGSRIVSSTSNRNGGFALYQKRTTGPSSEELLLPGQAAETFALDADSRFLDLSTA